jgi:hypothetical protein
VRRIFVTSTQLAASATFTGPALDLADPQVAGPDDQNRIGATANSDQTGTLYIDGSFDASTWRQAGSVAVAANVPSDLSVPIRYRYYRFRYINGATQTGAGNFAIHASLTEN